MAAEIETTAATDDYGDYGEFDLDRYNTAIDVFDQADNINMYWKPILFFVCFFGNGISLVVLNSKEFKGFPQKYLLTIIALVDISVGIIFLRNYLSMYVVPLGTSADTLIHDVSPAVCKSFMYFLYYTTHLSAWTIMLLTLERFFVTWYPLRSMDVLSSKRVLLIWIIMAIVIALIELPLVFIIEYSGFNCDFISPDWMQFWDRFDLAIMCIIPFLFLTVFDALIIFKLYTQRREMSAMNDANAKPGDDKLKGLTAMMLCICFLFILTTTPLAIYNFGSKSWFKSDDLLVMAYDYQRFTILDNIYLLNHSINFIFYFVVGPRFRRAFFNVFCRCLVKKSRPGTSKTASTALSRGSSVKK